MKVSIETQKSEVKELEIQIPHYRSNGHHFYKILGEDKIIQVFPSEWRPYIGAVHLELAFHGESKEINEQDFNAAFDKALEALKNPEVMHEA